MEDFHEYEVQKKRYLEVISKLQEQTAAAPH